MLFQFKAAFSRVRSHNCARSLKVSTLSFLFFAVANTTALADDPVSGSGPEQLTGRFRAEVDAGVTVTWSNNISDATLQQTKLDDMKEVADWEAKRVAFGWQGAGAGTLTGAMQNAIRMKVLSEFTEGYFDNAKAIIGELFKQNDAIPLDDDAFVSALDAVMADPIAERILLQFSKDYPGWAAGYDAQSNYKNVEETIRTGLEAAREKAIADRIAAEMEIDFVATEARIQAIAAKLADPTSYDGGLTKTGSGQLILTGDSTYSGDTIVDGGELVIGREGSITSASIVNDTGLFTVEGIAAATTVNKGGRLNVAAGGTAGDTSVIGGFAAINGASGATSVSEGGTVFGTGTLESLVAKSGGIVSPGNSVGTLNVSKDATFEKGSVFNVEIKPDFLSADQLAIAGEAMLLGGIVNVRLENDTALLTEDVTKSLFLKSFDIVTASKGVTGQFDGVWPRYNYITANLDYADRNKVVLGFDFTPDVKTAKIVELEKQLAALEAEKARLAEVKRIADEKAAEAEAKRIADEDARLAAEEAEKVKQAEEAEALAKAAADAKKLADQKAEEDRIAADRKRIADEKAAEAEAKRIADEDARLAAEEAEKVKQAEEAETLAKAAADAKKLADQKAEEDRIAADKKRIADEKAAEAEAKRVADEDARLAAEEAEKVKKAEEAEALAKAAADAKKLADQKAKDALEKKLLEAKLEAYLSPEYLAIGVKSRNQKGVWKGIQSAGWDNPLLAQVAVSKVADPLDFDALSGEVHASLSGVLAADGHFIADAATARLRNAFGGVAGKAQSVTEPLAYGPDAKAKQSDAFAAVEPAPASTALWAEAYGSWAHADSDGNASSYSRDTGGFVTGADGVVAQDWRLGVLAGYGNTALHGGRGKASVDSYQIGVYGGTKIDALGLRFGATYAHHEIDTKRTARFGNLNNEHAASHDAGSVQVFGEIGYEINTPYGALEPFAAARHVHVKTKSFNEDGAVSNLSGEGSSTDLTVTTIGLRASHTFTIQGDTPLTARGMLGWNHAFGDVTPQASLAFSGGQGFTVEGTPVAEDAAIVEAGFDLGISKSATLGLSYTGQFSSQNHDNTIKADLSVRF